MPPHIAVAEPAHGGSHPFPRGKFVPLDRLCIFPLPLIVIREVILCLRTPPLGRLFKAVYRFGSLLGGTVARTIPFAQFALRTCAAKFGATQKPAEFGGRTLFISLVSHILSLNCMPRRADFVTVSRGCGIRRRPCLSCRGCKCGNRRGNARPRRARRRNRNNSRTPS